MYIILISILFCVLYTAMVLVFVVGWRRIPLFEPVENVNLYSGLSVSVVIACKNEEINLPKLLSCLQIQSYQHFELILVNDHSSDATLSVMEAARARFLNIKVIDSELCGKKNALKEGILAAKGSLIVTTDADCIPGLGWLKMICSFQQKYPSDLIICPMQVLQSKSLFSRLQALEFTTLIASGAGAAGAGMPILCNGANLAFTKEAWLQSKHNLVEEQMSGDDIFLLQSIKKRGGVIRFLKSESAIIFTEPAKTLAAFFKQRRRWASKSPAYTDAQLIFTACTVFSISLWLIILVFSSLIYPSLLMVFFFTFGVKFLADIIFLYYIRSFFKIEHLWFDSFLLSLIYPFYIVSVAISSLLFEPKSWK
jgi:cellulose synthase/poly-beta-1,6-N-acetylglucosamine synthase-like glycosyltransferase